MSKNDLKAALQRRSAIAAQSHTAHADALDHVLGAVPAAGPAPAKILPGARLLSLNQIEADPHQPRRTMDQETLQGLADSIRENGLLQAIVVHWEPTTRVYRIITGHRRVAAARLLKLDSIPALVKSDDFDERMTLQQQLVENIQREGIPPVEEARALQALIDAQGLSQRQVATRLGKQVIYVNELLTILKIEPKLLARAAHLPKRVLVEIGRGKNVVDQERLLATALSSESPHSDVKRARAVRHKESAPRAVRSFKLPDRKATVTVTFDRPDGEVTSDDVLSALMQLAKQLLDAGAQSDLKR